MSLLQGSLQQAWFRGKRCARIKTTRAGRRPGGRRPWMCPSRRGMTATPCGGYWGWEIRVQAAAIERGEAHLTVRQAEGHDQENLSCWRWLELEWMDVVPADWVRLKRTGSWPQGPTIVAQTPWVCSAGAVVCLKAGWRARQFMACEPLAA